MAVGKSKRIVIEVDDISLKRRLYAALAADGHSLKSWFTTVVADYLAANEHGRQMEFGILKAAESIASYGESTTERKVR